MSTASKKRVLSSDDTTSGNKKPSRISKLKENFFNIIGFSRTRAALSASTSLKPKSDSDINSIDKSTNGSYQSNITSKQLHEYYEHIKRGNELLYASLGNNSPNSTSLEDVNTNILKSDNTTKDITEDTAQNRSISKRKGSGDGDKSLQIKRKKAKSQRKQKASSVQVKRTIGATFSIDPLERAQLIQMKKRMEADRYRKSRMLYLRDHTQNLLHSATTEPSTNPKYVDTAVETINYKPDLITDTLSASKKESNGQLISNNKEGHFQADFLYDEAEVLEELAATEAIQTIPLSKKIKFTAKKESKFAPALLDPSFDTATKPKSFIPTEENTTTKKSPELKSILKKSAIADTSTIADDTPVAPSAGFNFSTTSKSSPVGQELTKKTEKEEPVPAKSSLSISGSKSNEPAPAKPAFSFGVPKSDEFTTPKSSIGLDKKQGPIASSSFSFGAPKKEEATQSKPLSFGGTTPKSTFTFGATSEKESASEPKPIFSLTANKTDESTAAKPAAFSFGASSATKSEAPFFAVDAASKKEETEESKPKSLFGSATPAFGGSSTGTDGKKQSIVIEKPAEAPKPFSFSSGLGAASEKKEDVPAKPFSFGATAEKKEDATPKHFSFGSATEKKEADAPKPFTFGSTTEKKEDTTPKPFSFGSAIEKKEGDVPKPFTFGAASAKKNDTTTPSKGTQALTFSASTTDNKNEAKPAFSFGSNTAADKTASAPFSFGAPKAEIAKPSETTEADKTSTLFSFGTGSSSSQPKQDEAKPTAPFSFATDKKVETSKPAFSFGAPASVPSLSTTSSTPALNVGASAKGATDEDGREESDRPTKLMRKSEGNGFGHSSGSAPPAFGATTTAATSAFGATGSNGASAFGAPSTPLGSASAPTPGATSSAFGNVPTSSFNFGAKASTVPGNPTPAFGGFNASSGGASLTNPAAGSLFGGNNSNPGFSFNGNPSTPSTGSAFGNTNSQSAFSNPASKEGTPAFGINPQQQQQTKIFNLPNNFQMNPPQPSGGFGFGGSQGNGMPHQNGFQTQQQGGFNPSRSSTPNFNFSGQAQGPVDPSSIFNNSTPPPTGGPVAVPGQRRRIMPRSMLRRGQR